VGTPLEAGDNAVPMGPSFFVPSKFQAPIDDARLVDARALHVAGPVFLLSITNSTGQLVFKGACVLVLPSPTSGCCTHFTTSLPNVFAGLAEADVDADAALPTISAFTRSAPLSVAAQQKQGSSSALSAAAAVIKRLVGGSGAEFAAEIGSVAGQRSGAPQPAAATGAEALGVRGRLVNELDELESSMLALERHAVAVEPQSAVQDGKHSGHGLVAALQAVGIGSGVADPSTSHAQPGPSFVADSQQPKLQPEAVVLEVGRRALCNHALCSLALNATLRWRLWVALSHTDGNMEVCPFTCNCRVMMQMCGVTGWTVSS
jgi:hypothetical protein